MSQRFLIVASKFNDLISKALVEGAKEAFTESGVTAGDVDLLWVPGAFELPTVAAKAARWVLLQTKPVADKRLVAFVYNYPPGGDHFGASFLNVPRSLARVSQGLQDAGYAVTPRAEAAWIAGLKPLLSAYYPGTDLRALLAAHEAEALPLARYQAWFDALPAAVREPIVARWGPPASSRYVLSWQGQPVFEIGRAHV